MTRRRTSGFVTRDERNKKQRISHDEVEANLDTGPAFALPHNPTAADKRRYRADHATEWLNAKRGTHPREVINTGQQVVDTYRDIDPTLPATLRVETLVQAAGVAVRQEIEAGGTILSSNQELGLALGQTALNEVHVPRR